jgi:teichuronic acid exporter
MFKNIIWDYIGRFGNYLVSFLISIVLTRLLSVEEFGIMAIVMVVITMAAVFMDLGFNRAIIQQQQISVLQLSTIFYINLGVSFLLMLICFLLAGPLAMFYKQPIIKPLFQVVSISFLLNGLNLVPSALLYKRLKLKANSIILLSASLVSGLIGIIMAYSGYGIWSLVAQSLSSSCIILLLSMAYVKFLPTLQFNFSAIQPLWQYGSRMFASGLLDRLYSRLDSFIIGKIYSAETLGYYYRAQSLEGFVRTFSAGSLMGSLFPYIAKHQNDKPYLKDFYLKYLHAITFSAVGLCGLLFLVAPDLFVLLFTERWLYAAGLFQLMMLAGIVWPLSSLMVNMISGTGNAKDFLLLEVYKKITLFPVYVFGFIFGLKGFILFYVLASFVCLIFNMIFINKDFQVSVFIQVKLIVKYLFTGIIVCTLVWFLLSFIPTNAHLFRIFICSTVFLTLYFFSTFLFKLKGFDMLQLIYHRGINLLRNRKTL